MIKSVFIFGTRPEAIKMAPVIHRLKAEKENFEVLVCVTAQHREMLDQVLGLFVINPDYDLDIMRENQSIFDVSIRGLQKLESILKKEKPNLVLVQGDTTTTLVASLAAYYLRIKIGHIEAGLRTGDKFSPFPEEMNRKLTDALADFHFAATREAKENLLKEGVGEESVFVTGNTVIDALFMTREKTRNRQFSELGSSVKIDTALLEKIDSPGQRMILVTGHRRESFGPGFEQICRGLRKIAGHNRDVEIIYPVHLNPNVQEPVKRILGEVEGVNLIEPLEYAPFVWLLDRAYLILTDSGGIQEEAPSLGKPVLVMRQKTERPEAIEAGTAKLVGTESETIFRETQALLDDREQYKGMARSVNPFGDGHASERIAEIIRKHF